MDASLAISPLPHRMPLRTHVQRRSLVGYAAPAGRLPMSEVEVASGGDGFARLVVAIAQGRDRAAFAALFDHFAPRLKSWLIRTGTPPTAAEELAQEALFAVWTKAASFDPARGRVSTWVFTIARNLRHDQLRRLRLETGWAPDPTDEPEPSGSGESRLADAERDDLVRRALDALPPEQLQVVALSFYQHKPQSEIAQELGLPLGTVKSRVRLAMKHLRARLAELAP